MQNAIAPPYRRHRSGHRDRAYTTLDGRRVYLGPWESEESRRTYDRILAEYLAGGSTARPPAGHELTVSELLVRFWRFAKGYYRNADGSPSSALSDYRVALRPLRRLYGPTPAAEFGPNKLRAIRETWIQAGLSRHTVSRYTTCIKRVYGWAPSHELLPKRVHDNLLAIEDLRRGRSAARETEPVRPVPDADIEPVRKLVAPQVAAMIDLQLLTAMRPGEVVTMRGCDLDTSAKIWTYTPQHHKTEHHGHDRTVYVGPKAQLILKPFLRRDLAAYLFTPTEAEQTRAAAAPTHRRPGQTPTPRATQRRLGERYTSCSYRRAVHRACNDAGIPRWAPNRLRHNAATLLRREYGLEVAQAVLGHRIGSKISELYAEMNTAKAIEVIGQVG